MCSMGCAALCRQDRVRQSGTSTLFKTLHLPPYALTTALRLDRDTHTRRRSCSPACPFPLGTWSRTLIAVSPRWFWSRSRQRIVPGRQICHGRNGDDWCRWRRIDDVPSLPGPDVFGRIEMDRILAGSQCCGHPSGLGRRQRQSVFPWEFGPRPRGSKCPWPCGWKKLQQHRRCKRSVFGSRLDLTYGCLVGWVAGTLSENYPACGILWPWISSNHHPQVLLVRLPPVKVRSTLDVHKDHRVLK